MTLQLSLNLATAPSAPAKGLASVTNEAAGDQPGSFGALLDLGLDLAAGSDAEATIDATSQTSLTAAPGGMLGTALTVEAAADAAAKDAPHDSAAEASLLGDFVDLLSAIDTAVAANQPVDPAVLAKLDLTLDALSVVLGGDVALQMPEVAVGTPTDGGEPAPLLSPLGALTELLAGKTPPLQANAATAKDAGVDAAASPLLPAQASPKAELALAKEVHPSHGFASKVADLAAALAPHSPEIAAKLEALVEKLGSGALSTAALARLGVHAKDLQSVDADLEAALTALLAPKAETKPLPAQLFATPELELPAAAFGDRLAATAKDAKSSALANMSVGDAEIALETGRSDPGAATKAATAGGETRVAIDIKPAVQTAIAAVVATARDTSIDPAQTAQQGGSGPRTDFAIGVRAVHAAYQAPQTQINLPQLAFEIVRHAADGHNRFQIRLDPAELGRIDVRLDLDGNGGINAKLTVERAETLDLLQRDQRSLEKALAQAGLDSAKTSLEFSLKQNPFSPSGDSDSAGSPFAQAADKAGAEAEVEALPVNAYRGAATAGGVNIFV